MKKCNIHIWYFFFFGYNTIKENKTLEQRGPWRIGFQINRCKVVEGKKLEVERRIV